MPPHLHPRSRSTTSLFAATLLASFFIVGMPHIFPCPAPRRALADSNTIITPDGQQERRIRRRRRKATESPEQTQSIEGIPTPSSQVDEELTTFLQMEKEAKALEKTGRECPVPKPRGIMGQILGFGDGRGSSQALRTDISGREPER
jgi:cytochrome c oxidase assembly factor 2